MSWGVGRTSTGRPTPLTSPPLTSLLTPLKGKSIMKDLTQYLAPDLVLKYHDREFVVPPPTKDDGLKLAAITAYGTAIATGSQDNLPDGQRKLAESLAGVDLGEISLGPAYLEMSEANVPGPHIDQYAMYAMYYWVMGEDVADQIMEARYGSEGSEAPKDRPEPSKNGPSTE